MNYIYIQFCFIQPIPPGNHITTSHTVTVHLCCGLYYSTVIQQSNWIYCWVMLVVGDLQWCNLVNCHVQICETEKFWRYVARGLVNLRWEGSLKVTGSAGNYTICLMDITERWECSDLWSQKKIRWPVSISRKFKVLACSLNAFPISLLNGFIESRTKPTVWWFIIQVLELHRKIWIVE